MSEANAGSDKIHMVEQQSHSQSKNRFNGDSETCVAVTYQNAMRNDRGE